MRDYELLYIVSGDQTEDQATKVTDAINAALLKFGGKVESENVWGRRRLAYVIDKQDHGWYVITRFAIDPIKLGEFQHGLNINKALLRSLIVAAAEVPTAEEAERIESAVKESEQAAEAREKEEKAPKPAPATAAKTTTKEAAKPTVKKTEKETEAKPPKKETAADRKERQAKLDEKLGEILKDE